MGSRAAEWLTPFCYYACIVGIQVARAPYMPVVRELQDLRRYRCAENFDLGGRVRSKWCQLTDLFDLIFEACTVSSRVARAPCRALFADVWLIMSIPFAESLHSGDGGEIERWRITDVFSSVNDACGVHSRVASAVYTGALVDMWDMM